MHGPAKKLKFDVRIAPAPPPNLPPAPSSAPAPASHEVFGIEDEDEDERCDPVPERFCNIQSIDNKMNVMMSNKDFKSLKKNDKFLSDNVVQMIINWVELELGKNPHVQILMYSNFKSFLPKRTIFKWDSSLILLPVLDQKHWFLFIGDICNNGFYILDSALPSSEGGLEDRELNYHEDTCKTVKELIEETFRKEHDGKVINLETKVLKVPQQKLGNLDCALYMVGQIESILRGGVNEFLGKVKSDSYFDITIRARKDIRCGMLRQKCSELKQQVYNFKCEKCGETFKSKGKLVHHKKWEHKNWDAFRAKLYQKIEQLTQLKLVKEQNKIDKEQFKCLKCSQIFETKITLRHHMKKNHTITKTQKKNMKKAFEMRANNSEPTDALRKSTIIQCKLCLGGFGVDKEEGVDTKRYIKDKYNQETQGNNLEHDITFLRDYSYFYLHHFKEHVRLHTAYKGQKWTARTYRKFFGVHDELTMATFHKCHLEGCGMTFLFSDDKVRNHLGKIHEEHEATDYFSTHLYPFWSKVHKAIEKKAGNNCIQCQSFKVNNGLKF